MTDAAYEQKKRALCRQLKSDSGGIRLEKNTSSLFFGIPNSYRTLGYILRLTARTMPVKPCVELRHTRFDDVEKYFCAVAGACDGDADFIDGVIFGLDEMYLTRGRFTDSAPYSSD